jgi:hypothetical protein
MNAKPVAPPRLALKWRFALAIMNRQFARQLARLTLDGYLAEVGWTRSAREGVIVGRDGSPLPWATYSFIEFIGPRLRTDFAMFEYGAGASTLYYASRVAKVITVEHDAVYAVSVRAKLPINAELWEHPLGPDYINSVAVMSPAPILVAWMPRVVIWLPVEW